MTMPNLALRQGLRWARLDSKALASIVGRIVRHKRSTVMANAEAVRIGPSTDSQKIAQRDILQRINGA